MFYNTTIKTPADLEFIGAKEIEDYSLNRKEFRYEHPARKWEYGLAIELIKEYKPQTMINVGGGNSPLSSWAAEKSIDVTEIDPNRPAQLFANIKYIHDAFPVHGLGQFEFVVSTSVIEHVPGTDDMHFFKALLDHSSDLVLITMDFHPSGKQFSYAHERTYTPTDLQLMIEVAKIRGFSPIGNTDYRFVEPMVYDYTFAALALIRDV